MGLWVVLVGVLACNCLCGAAGFSSSSSSARPFPAFFIFGDSLVDVGNNNYILSVAKASNLPFGIDFPTGPTGRFTNGKTVADVFAELINLPYPPPYLDPRVKGEAILQGVNFASAASGILRSSGFNFIGRIDFDTQIDWFANTAKQLNAQLGETASKEFLAKSLFASVFGSNDYVNNYLLSYAPINKVYTTDQLKYVLLNKTKEQIKRIYDLGARLIVVPNIGPIGCIPSQLVRQRSVNGECSQYVNDLAQDFNADLEMILRQLNKELPGSEIVYADVFTNVYNYVQNYQEYGFKSASKACCGGGKYNGQLLCLPIIKACPNRRDYVFFDAFHPCQAANELLGNALYQKLLQVRLSTNL